MLSGSSWDSDLKHWLSQRSASLGFDLTGVAAVENPDHPVETTHASRFEAWVDAGRAGEMDYLKRRDDAGRLLRGSVRIAQPWVNSVVVCAMSYKTPGPLSIDPAHPTSGWIARYAWTGETRTGETRTGESQSHDSQAPQPESPLAPTDYHDFLLTRLHDLAQSLEHRAGGVWKCYVDTGPLVERDLAARAGIGWIGKNTCVLNQGRGSWLLLGVILSSLHLPAPLATLPAADRCGSCTRCIDACPTGALTAPREMDASLCIAYLTIEKKGTIPTDLRPQMGRQVFGCDICQDVCPWNRPDTTTTPIAITPRPELINPDLGWLAAMDAPAFRHWFKGSPLERTRRSRLHRNVAIAMGNSGERRFLPQLTSWSSGDDPVLAEAASWAIARLTRPDDLPRPDPAPELDLIL